MPRASRPPSRSFIGEATSIIEHTAAAHEHIMSASRGSMGRSNHAGSAGYSTGLKMPALHQTARYALSRLVRFRICSR